MDKLELIELIKKELQAKKNALNRASYALRKQNAINDTVTKQPKKAKAKEPKTKNTKEQKTKPKAKTQKTKVFKEPVSKPLTMVRRLERDTNIF